MNYDLDSIQVLAASEVYDALQIQDMGRLATYHDLRAGQHERARERYAQNHPQVLPALENPQWLLELPPRIKRKTISATIDLALILAEMGDKAQSEQLLEDILRVIEIMPRREDMVTRSQM